MWHRDTKGANAVGKMALIRLAQWRVVPPPPFFKTCYLGSERKQGVPGVAENFHCQPSWGKVEGNLVATAENENILKLNNKSLRGQSKASWKKVSDSLFTFPIFSHLLHISGFQQQLTFAIGDVWQCPEIFLVVKTKRCYSHLASRGQGCC